MSLLTTTTTISSTPTITPTRTWSYQLQFNFKFRKSQLHTPLMFLGARNSYLIKHRRHNDNNLLVNCVAQDEAAKSNSNSQRRRSGDSAVDAAFSDWFGNSEDSSDDSPNKHGIGGILGAGLAGLLLVAGITSAAMSIGKRSSSRSIPEMKPITEQQEAFVTSEEEVYREEDNRNDGKFDVHDEGKLQNGNHLESKAGMENDISSSLGPSEYVSQEALVDDTNVDSVDGSFVTSRSIDLQSTIEVSKTEDHLDFGLNNAEAGAGPLSTIEQQEALTASETNETTAALESTSSVIVSTEFQNLDSSATADAAKEADGVRRGEVPLVVSVASEEENEHQRPLQDYGESNIIPVDGSSSKKIEAIAIATSVAQSFVEKQGDGSDDIGGRSDFESQSPLNVLTSRGIPAPSLLSAAHQVPTGKVLVPAVTDQSHSQALAALQVLKVIESDAQPGDLCTRREYARWLVSASSALSRNLILKVYPAMYIENVTELAFDDITPEDPDFASIQGLAEAGLISSKLSRRDMLSSREEDIDCFYFNPDSPLSRQDLVTWKMVLEKRQLPEADRKALHQLSGFIDIDKIDPDACPALVADISAAEQGIVALAFGYTRLFQPDKPVTKGQAAIALATGEAADVVSEELARIEAESIADKAVTTHNALVAEVEKDVNANFEKELLMERGKIDAVQKMAEEAKQEVERLRAEREERSMSLMKERATVESEMEVLSKLRHELEEQLQSVMSNKAEISYEKERIEKLKKETEEENQAIIRLQYELEVERKALSMARAWAEDEAKRVQEHAKALEEARDRWERKGLKVMVDEDLREEASADSTWTNVSKKLSVEETAERAETLMDKLKVMAGEVSGKSKEIINKIIQKIQSLISAIKAWICEAGRRTTEYRDIAVAKVGGSVEELQQNAAGFSATVKEGAKRVAGDCRESVEKLTQRFKT